jgi:antitoxin component YwqK of YwqJK toxin-antitoxin module
MRFLFSVCLLISFVVSSQNDTTSGWKSYTYPSGKQSSAGNLKNGLPVGEWTNFFESGEIRSKGKWNEKGLDSVWVFYTEKGKIERSISYANNLKNGLYLVYDSLELISFNGFYINDTLQGPFKRFENGKLIEEGNYQDGEIKGIQREYDPNTGVLITIKDGLDEERINRTLNGKKEGLWQTFNAKGELLTQELYSNGELVKDDSDSTATFKFEKEFYTNGQLKARYVLDNGKKSGVQSNFDENGNAMVSQLFKQDTLISEGWFTADGLKDSLWQSYSRDGQVLSKGNYVAGKKDGMWFYYFGNKQVEQKGRYIDDLPTGEWIWYYPNGQVRRQENFFRGKYEGEILDYDSTGKLIQKQTYAYNTTEGDYYYFIGDRQVKGKLQNGLREGKWIYNYANGKKAFSAKYKDGLLNGKQKIWYPTGKRESVTSYKKGKVHGKKLEYYEKGGLMHLYYFQNDKLISVDGVVIKGEKIKLQ